MERQNIFISYRHLFRKGKTAAISGSGPGSKLGGGSTVCRIHNAIRNPAPTGGQPTTDVCALDGNPKD